VTQSEKLLAAHYYVAFFHDLTALKVAVEVWKMAVE
jgi:hypothetical protein